MLPLATVWRRRRRRSPISSPVSWGSVAGWFVALCAVVSCFGCPNGWLFMSGELLASMTDAGALPGLFGQRNAAGAPAPSILIGSVVTTLLTMMAHPGRRGGLQLRGAHRDGHQSGDTPVCARRRAVHADRTAAEVDSACRLCGGSLMFVTWAFYGSGQEALIWGAVLPWRPRGRSM